MFSAAKKKLDFGAGLRRFAPWVSGTMINGDKLKNQQIIVAQLSDDEEKRLFIEERKKRSRHWKIRTSFS